MNDYDFAKVLAAIGPMMPCEQCPYPCGRGWASSQANCDRHWYKILAGIDNSLSWEEVSDRLWEIRRKDD